MTKPKSSHRRLRAGNLEPSFASRDRDQRRRETDRFGSIVSLLDSKMNTIKSTWIGWGALCVAGGGAYYFAKRSINADRLTRFDATQKRKDEMAKAEASARAAAEQSKAAVARAGKLNSGSQKDDAYSPSEELGHDPAPTRHEPDTDAQRLAEKGKYEAAEVFRSRKGDRFS
ncbi:hypothetical protein H112_04763 [Trichophyton rubrum D6]|uniref:Uncharacterized protein n=5 Tax=Trichophyton TaxID=5550 RepID=F2SNM0_TRIRC|nr:uncharacterized protein TERG_04528 [Trichophyton rubrum CBS 118892]EZF22308.1 hypothetical protein H100_04772 [Trichophyton rubrum MR850]EZF41456.1 hypothetical protein H102_04759 [Trichophyton rubrum CBS 100081]EZF52031.1 hypothetical protein H103_04764 [Trichophyton rubrum CBS 288.86]EZF62687.1 hypothetical protein H104_04750 [Trichophyton rubrum CBS 289.86]EZF73311.1 hypothetical protein H105_04781 [Trichophyton soudanense CBS 452.61]EZF83935.1 hypothetical protein H110_04760 [Trichophy